MLLPILTGYFVCVFLLVCGVLNCMEYLAHMPDNCSNTLLLNGLAEAGWPIIAASVILLLIQLNKQLEKLRMEYSEAPGPRNAKPQKAGKNTVGREDAPPAAPKAEVPPQPAAGGINLANLVPSAPAHSPMRPTNSPHTPVYPNSPIPGGGRVPQSPRPEPIPDTRCAKRAPSKTEAGSLNFFKVD